MLNRLRNTIPISRTVLLHPKTGFKSSPFLVSSMLISYRRTPSFQSQEVKNDLFTHENIPSNNSNQNNKRYIPHKKWLLLAFIIGSIPSIYTLFKKALDEHFYIHSQFPVEKMIFNFGISQEQMDLVLAKKLSGLNIDEFLLFFVVLTLNLLAKQKNNPDIDHIGSQLYNSISLIDERRIIMNKTKPHIEKEKAIERLVDKMLEKSKNGHAIVPITLLSYGNEIFQDKPDDEPKYKSGLHRTMWDIVRDDQDNVILTIYDSRTINWYKNGSNNFMFGKPYHGVSKSSFNLGNDDKSSDILKKLLLDAHHFNNSDAPQKSPRNFSDIIRKLSELSDTEPSFGEEVVLQRYGTCVVDSIVLVLQDMFAPIENGDALFNEVMHILRDATYQLYNHEKYWLVVFNLLNLKNFLPYSELNHLESIYLKNNPDANTHELSSIISTHVLNQLKFQFKQENL